MPLEKHLFQTGMDSDSSNETILPTSYRYALNIRANSPDGANEGSITNVLGNTLVSFQLPAATNTVIGSYEYKIGNKIYYFVYNSNGNHQILEYDSVLNSISSVLNNPVLNFNPNFLITGINVIELDANNHLLYWTDNNEEPKKINIEKGKFFTSTGGNPTNSPLGYISPFIGEYIYRIKAPDLHPPSCTYGSDPTVNVNLLVNQLFQFKSQYIYDDFEQSATSPISVVPFPTLNCQQNPAPSVNNFISVTINTGSEIVKKINILGRIGNTGDFYLIVTLDKTLLNIPSNSTTTYKYYNNANYNAIDINTSIKLFDNVPIKSLSQELIEGERIVDGDVVQGYDNVPINAQLNLSLAPTQKTTTFGFSGRIYIGNFFNHNTHFQTGQPIWSTTGNTSDAVFGGFAPSILTIPTIANVHAFGQTIPLGGFVVYLAGTGYHCISQQSAPSNVTKNSQNVFTANSNNHKNAIANAISADQVYSSFTFSGVPPGKYVMRIGSHLLTQTDLNGDIDVWQRTSTNTICVGGDKNNECEIEITPTGDIIVGSNNFGVNGTIYPSMIMDLSNPVILDAAQAITGYVTDDDITSPTPSQYIEDTRIELAQVTFHTSSWGFRNNWNPILSIANANVPNFHSGSSYEISNWYSSNKMYTDHNGYFYITDNYDSTDPLARLTIQTGGFQSGANNLQASQFSFANPPSAFAPPVSNGSSMGIFRNTQTSVSDHSRTKINGNILYNGIGIAGIIPVNTEGGLGVSDVYGQFSIYAYVDTRVNQSTIGVRSGHIYYEIADNCIAVFNPATEYYSINIGTPSVPQSVFVSPYNGTYDILNQLTIVDATIISIVGGNSTVSLKRGSTYQLGIVYYDHGNRSGLTNTNNNNYLTQNAQGDWGNLLVIPFFTETANPLVSNPNVVNNGAPIVSWSIYSLPPVWATHYQWVRTLNGTLTDYLQFTAKNVTYTDNYRNTVPYTQATLIGINIQNIANYANQHGDSVLNFGTSGTTVNYIPSVGDRIRFIKDANGNFFNSYIDEKIVTVDPAGIVYINNVLSIGTLTAGFLFETYTPKLQTPSTVNSSQIYYEIGECYDIGNPGQINRYHKGQTQDQNPANPSGVPATGTFSNGDTYSRIRNIPYGGTNPLTTTNQKAWYIEDANFSDFFQSKVSDIGRPNLVNPTFKQVREKANIYYSELFIPETQINGLSSVFDTNFASYDLRYGSITKLFSLQRWLDVYQELKVGRIPINQAQIQSSSNIGGQSVVGQSTSVLNPIIYYEGEFGCQNPESFTNYANDRYFFDLKRGAVLRLSNDGLFAVSNYRFKNFISQLSNTIQNTGIKANFYGVFDVKFREYVLSLQSNALINVNGTFVSPDVTFAFNEKYNLWSSFYSYLAENMCTNGVNIVTFKDGRLYTHNTNQTRNNFYGVQYGSEVDVVINGLPSKEKVLAAISEECKNIWTSPSITTPNGQLSNLIAQDFILKQNMQYAAVLRDQNTPNISNPLVEGDILVDTSFTVKLVNNDTTEVKMFACNAYWQPQERSNR